jgi:tetratricopeptide (TPR) repeat protein
MVKTGEGEQARRFFEAQAQKTPQNGFLLHILGEINEMAGNRPAAEAYFKQSIDIDPMLASSYLKLAEIHGKNGDKGRQVEVLETCIRAIPAFPEASIELARLCLGSGEWKKAAETLEKAFLLNPDSPVLANNLAWLYLEQGGKLNQALNLAQFAYGRLPEDPAIADTLGWAYFKKNMHSQAIWYLSQACTMAPDNGRIHFHLGTVYLSKKEVQKARESFAKALKLNLEPSEREEAKKYISGPRQSNSNREGK